MQPEEGTSKPACSCVHIIRTRSLPWSECPLDTRIITYTTEIALTNCDAIVSCAIIVNSRCMIGTRDRAWPYSVYSGNDDSVVFIFCRQNAIGDRRKGDTESERMKRNEWKGTNVNRRETAREKERERIKKKEDRIRRNGIKRDTHFFIRYVRFKSEIERNC